MTTHQPSYYRDLISRVLTENIDLEPPSREGLAAGRMKRGLARMFPDSNGDPKRIFGPRFRSIATSGDWAISLTFDTSDLPYEHGLSMPAMPMSHIEVVVDREYARFEITLAARDPSQWDRDRVPVNGKRAAQYMVRALPDAGIIPGGELRFMDLQPDGNPFYWTGLASPGSWMDALLKITHDKDAWVTLQGIIPAGTGA